ncbi:cell filamentation protein Fic [Candidatus Peregrinibacteria bacterium]|jgi:cell filamentation protein|nr:cell filamentation protein Fic [Candidatus Peregrinibacteria bacterium]MBT7702828.1 cell filamentation protein Fic [Candidatus Peregrinibacteria bacterium]
MAAASRYNVDGDEADVSKNKLGITDPKELGDAETVLLTDAYDYFLELLDKGKLNLKLDLIFELHEYFLGMLYSWAGKVRTVNISKGNMLFMPPNQIKKVLKDFESEFKKNCPRPDDSKKEIVRKIAYLYCELNVIHPFREGNGRTIRLFMDLFLASCGYEGLDFRKISEVEYIAACKKGTLKDYKPMEKIVFGLLNKKTELE